MSPSTFVAERDACAPVLDVRAPDEFAGGHLAGAINFDAHPDLARHYGVRVIPAVKLLAGVVLRAVDGTVAAEFTGALPEAEVHEWLGAHFPV